VGYFFLLAVVANAMPLHLPLILQERGAPTNVQALSLTVTGITMLVARPTMGWVLDTFPVRWVLVGMTMGPLAGVLLLLAGGGAAGALVSAIGFGMALGGEVVALNYIISRAFPLERYGSTFGWCMLVLGLAVAGGPIAISTLVHFGGSYEAPLIMMLVGSLLALFICFFLNDARVRRPTKSVLVQQGI
jgi:MFS family permease